MSIPRHVQVPFIVAVTKVDLMSPRDLERAMKGIGEDLMKSGFMSENDGGDIQVCSRVAQEMGRTEIHTHGLAVILS